MMARNWHDDSTTVLSAYPDLPGARTPTRVLVVGILAGASGLVAALIGAVSLTRIAGELLGFPEYLEWTLTGAVDIGAAAGAVLWVTSQGSDRRRGQWLNIACSLVSAVGVGLDHASHANAEAGWAWPWVAFAIGAFLPALYTWLIHVLAHLVTDTSGGRPAGKDGGESAGAGSGALDVASPPSPSLVITNGHDPALVATNGHSPDTDEAQVERKRAADAERKRKSRRKPPPVT